MGIKRPFAAYRNILHSFEQIVNTLLISNCKFVIKITNLFENDTNTLSTCH